MTLTGMLPLIIGTVLYLWQAANLYMSGDKAMTIVFLGYSVANIGLIIGAMAR